MSTRDLAAKYGKNRNSRRLINDAIRAELVGGAEALDALELLRQQHERQGTPETHAALAAIHRIIDAMAAEIRQRYGLPQLEQPQ
jgi:hypothetical protein